MFDGLTRALRSDRAWSAAYRAGWRPPPVVPGPLDWFGRGFLTCAALWLLDTLLR